MKTEPCTTALFSNKYRDCISSISECYQHVLTNTKILIFVDKLYEIREKFSYFESNKLTKRGNPGLGFKMSSHIVTLGGVGAVKHAIQVGKSKLSMRRFHFHYEKFSFPVEEGHLTQI